MPFFIASIILQALLIIHCIKTGRNQIWIWVLALLSYAGVIAYVAVEIVPDMFRSRAARRAARGVSRALDPGRDLRQAAERAQASGNVASRQAWADELAKQGRHTEAIEVYRSALTGLYEFDPKLMLGLAGAQFAGKLSFAAPEQFVPGARIGPHTDVYSLALVLAAAARGKSIPLGTSIASAQEARRGVPDLAGVPPAIASYCTSSARPTLTNCAVGSRRGSAV